MKNIIRERGRREQKKLAKMTDCDGTAAHTQGKAIAGKKTLQQGRAAHSLLFQVPCSALLELLFQVPCSALLEIHCFPVFSGGTMIAMILPSLYCVRTRAPEMQIAVAMTAARR